MNTESLTIVELRKILKSRNMSTIGSKNDMVKRLLDAGVTMGASTSETIGAAKDRREASPLETADDTIVEIASEEGELERLRREIEIEELRAQLARLRSRSEEHQEARPNWKEIKDLVGKFDGSNWSFEQWEKQMRQLLAFYKLDEHSAKALVCSRLSGKAMKWYHSRTDCVELSHLRLLEELKRMYGQRIDKLALRRELEARKWRANEAFADYLHDKVTLANRVPLPEEETICYIVDGIPDQGLRCQAKVQCYRTIDALLTAFADLTLPQEAVKRTFVQHREDLTVRARTSSAPSVASARPPAGEKPKEQSPMRCYNCNELGHLAAGCTKPRKIRGPCYKCGQAGHLARRCRPSASVNCVTHQLPEDEDFCRTIEVCQDEESGNFSISLNALFDSGSPISFIKEKCVPRVMIENDLESKSFRGINDSQLKVIGRMDAIIDMNDKRYKVGLRVVPNNTMVSSVILGRDFLKVARLSFSGGKTVESSVGIESADDREADEIMRILNVEADAGRNCMTARDMIINEKPPVEVKQEAYNLFAKHYIDAQRPPKPAVENIMKLTLTDSKPFSCTPRRLAYTEKVKLRGILDELIRKGVVRESTSEYASSIVLIKKKNGETRMCVDFQTLNKITARDNFPLPLIEDQLDVLEGKRYFTTLDLRDGFFHIKMHDDSIKYTSNIRLALRR